MDMSSQSIEKLFARDARWREAIWPIKAPKNAQTWKEERRKSEFSIWDLHVEAVLRWLFSWRRQIGGGGERGGRGEWKMFSPCGLTLQVMLLSTDV